MWQSVIIDRASQKLSMSIYNTKMWSYVLQDFIRFIRLYVNFIVDYFNGDNKNLQITVLILKYVTLYQGGFSNATLFSNDRKKSGLWLTVVFLIRKLDFVVFSMLDKRCETDILSQYFTYFSGRHTTKEKVYAALGPFSNSFKM